LATAAVIGLVAVSVIARRPHRPWPDRALVSHRQQPAGSRQTTRQEQHETSSCDESKRRHGAASSGRGEHQLEQGDGVTQTRLEWPEGTVSVVRRDECPLGHECDNSDV
jgi:hypothetical protein